MCRKMSVKHKNLVRAPERFGTDKELRICDFRFDLRISWRQRLCPIPADSSSNVCNSNRLPGQV